MQKTEFYKGWFTRWLAICVLFAATVGSFAQLCAAAEVVDQQHDCHEVATDTCHGAECGSDLSRSPAHSCCPAFIGLIPSVGAVPIPDYFSGLVFHTSTLVPKDRLERLFRPPRTLS